jgi:peptidoglycan hydrolase-like protein with peptidoglycan-binding domain
MRYSEFKIVEAIPPNDVVGNKMDSDNDIAQGLEAGPPYPPEQVDDVKALQTRLEELGYSVGNTGIDGKYGPRTERAVAAFKRDNNVTPATGDSVDSAASATLATATKLENPTPTGNNSRYSGEPLGDLADVANLGQAKEVVEEFLGSEISDNDMNMLVRATASEASRHNQERAAVAAVILNRVRLNHGNYGASIPAQLNAKNQFQAVTGTRYDRGPSDGYRNMSTRTAGEVIGTIIQNLPSQNKTWRNFTSNIESAYGPGTDINFLYTMRNSPGAEVIGQTVFGTA